MMVQCVQGEDKIFDIYIEKRKDSPKSMRRRMPRRKTLPDSAGLEAGTLLDVEHPSPPPWLPGSRGLSEDGWLDDEDPERGFIEDSEEPASVGPLDLNCD